jgi:hypothetical protein
MRHLLLLPILATAIAVAAETAPPIPSEATAAFKVLTKQEFRAHLAFLADDLLEGRGTGARGHEIAARYVGEQFEALGLRPAGAEGTYYQRVPLREVTVVPEECAIQLTRAAGSVDLKWGDDFLVGGNVNEPNASAEGGVVFVGFGIRTPDGKYDDYAGIDVKGKIVALLPGAPSFLQSEVQAHVSSRQEKARNASAHGAIGTVSLWTVLADRSLPWPRVVIGSRFPGMRWVGPNGIPADGFPQIKANATLSVHGVEALFQQSPKPWAAVLRDAALGKPQSFALPVTMHIKATSHHRNITSPNVAGILPGSDPKLSHEYVVYTAHSDHLGIGTPINGDAIYNGAADDGSGTAALLVLAKAFASMPRQPARSILFLAVTAEEKGLLGSDYYAHYPTVPIADIVANVNMDGAAMFYTFKDIVALGSTDSTLDAVVRRNAARLDLKVTPDPEPEQHYFVRADQYSFVKQGVPSVIISEGTEARDPKIDGKKFQDEWTANRYHAPSDDMNQPMDLAAAEEFMQLDFLVGYDIAQDPQRPTWKPGDFFGELFGHRK